ncbi:variable surface protein [Plasmodium gonderi]|uniref:Variable surface protein n=1 Tax=Plasmodium gonderi TaxID=77519 RepID=A0A1Y1JR31_PLAGO|nr:variable surface protein [Plasmodium gonderi]GAW84700.1 variable surface protein [Plasmodium gonderi]
MSTEYLNYDDYVLYSGTISNAVGDKGSTIKIDEFPISEENVKDIKDIISTYLWIIKRYFEYVNKNDSLDKNRTCNYIKYWLKNDLTIKYNNQRKSIINYLNNNIDTYNIVPKESGCIFDIKVDDDVKYKKIQKLYDVYNEYRMIKHLITKYDYLSTKCLYIKCFINKYNEILDSTISPRDADLFPLLIYIRCIYEYNKFISNKNCDDNFPNISDKNISAYYRERCNNLKKEWNVRDQIMHIQGNSVNFFPINNTNKYLILTTVFVCAVFGGIFLYFYKFRESWNSLHFRFQRKMRKKMNMNHEPCEYIIRKYEFDCAVPHEKMYNITYNSVR